MMNNLGHWSFIAGVVLAFLAAFFPTLQTTTMIWVLFILGLIVGFLNITSKETAEFLLAAVALLICADAARGILAMGPLIFAILSNIIAFVFPAALLVALRTIWVLAKS
jgi:hypothetical protein